MGDQQPWQQPQGQPVYYVQSVPFSGMAVTGFVLSLLFGCGFLSLPGLILGVLGMRECERTGKRGKGLAIAAIVIGAIGTLFLVLWGIGMVMTAAGYES